MNLFIFFRFAGAKYCCDCDDMVCVVVNQVHLSKFERFVYFWSCVIGSANVAGAPNMSVREDEIDILLDKLDGKIQRQRDETM